MGAARAMLLMLGHAAAFQAVGHLPALRTPHGPRMVAGGSLDGGGGDLAGGTDRKRNAQLEKLRKMYAAPHIVFSETTFSSDTAPLEPETSNMGLIPDLHIFSSDKPLLPHHQATINIWQPEYTLMFSSLLTLTEPHYYLHIFQPDDDEPAADADEKSDEQDLAAERKEPPLIGTLTRVVYHRRETDQRLTLVVQGLARAVITRATQRQPYVRADVQLLPDHESLLTAAFAVRRFIRTSAATPAAFAASKPSSRRKLTMAVAAAETESCFAYEALGLSIGPTGTIASLNQFNASDAALGAMQRANPNVNAEAVIRTVPMGPSTQFPKDSTQKRSRGRDLDDEDDGQFEGTCALEFLKAADQEASAASITLNFSDDGESRDEKEAEEEARTTLNALEVQLWLELDDLVLAVNNYWRAAHRGRQIKFPTQILGLLPPPPDLGWPSDFQPVHERARLMQVWGKTGNRGVDWVWGRPISFVPVDKSYPDRRRAERLSWVVWQVIAGERMTLTSDDGWHLQEVLDSQSTADRLRLALLRMRTLKAGLVEEPEEVTNELERLFNQPNQPTRSRNPSDGLLKSDGPLNPSYGWPAPFEEPRNRPDGPREIP